ncbi:protein downy mildew resistance 6 [Tanacetum coccineum]
MEGRSSYARAMIELRADVELKDNIVAVMPKITREGYYICNIRVECDWKPPREYVGNYVMAVRDLGMRILESISESLGLEKDRIVKILGDQGQHMAINHYPVCPEPELTYGLPGHTDPNALTILLQDTLWKDTNALTEYVGNYVMAVRDLGMRILESISESLGLEKDRIVKILGDQGQHMAINHYPPVKPHLTAFVFNLAINLEAVSNGEYKSVWHRAVVNSDKPRMSIASFLCPCNDSILSAPKELVKDGSKPVFKDFTFISVHDLNVIRCNCIILGDPKPFPGNKTPSVNKFIPPKLEEDHVDPDVNDDRPHADEPTAPKQKCSSCSQTQSRKRERQSSDNKEDGEIGACFEKLEKLGWEEGPMYDTAVLLFGESSDYRKIWLHLKPKSCVNWVKNAGERKYSSFVTQCRKVVGNGLRMLELSLDYWVDKKKSSKGDRQWYLVLLSDGSFSWVVSDYDHVDPDLNEDVDDGHHKEPPALNQNLSDSTRMIRFYIKSRAIDMLILKHDPNFSDRSTEAPNVSTLTWDVVFHQSVLVTQPPDRDKEKSIPPNS